MPTTGLKEAKDESCAWVPVSTMQLLVSSDYYITFIIKAYKKGKFFLKKKKLKTKSILHYPMIQLVHYSQ